MSPLDHEHPVSPERVAAYFNVIRKRCPRCQVVAADVLDDPNMVSWVRRFQRLAPGPHLWGLHNYRDANPRPGQLYGGTRRLLSVSAAQPRPRPSPHSASRGTAQRRSA